MIEDLINHISQAIGNPYLTLYVISIIPIVELRGAILTMPYMFPNGTIQEFLLGMLCCIAGSTTVILPLILLTRPLLRKLRRSKWFSKIGRRMESNLANKAESAYSEEEYQKNASKHKRPISKDAKKFWGLFTFVAIPLPMTGAWTGSCIGSFLDFSVWKASLAVSLYFVRSKRAEKKRKTELEKYKNKSEYELAVLKKEADEDGKVLVKKEYIDENGDKHIVIGHDEKRNKNIVDKDDVI